MWQIYLAEKLTPEVINGHNSYRVRCVDGTYNILAKLTWAGCYHYAIRKKSGKIYKVYIGTTGGITLGDLSAAIERLKTKLNDG